MNLKGLLFNADGTLSMSKLGAGIVSVCTLIVALPVVGVAVPAGVLIGATTLGSLGVKIWGDGARNAHDKTQAAITLVTDELKKAQAAQQK
jgi:hypothetical protein